MGGPEHDRSNGGQRSPSVVRLRLDDRAAPALRPPIPYNRLYDPDRMPAPICGNCSEDHADEQIPWMNHAIWAEDVGPMQARAFKARYYGEITYIDACIGRILDAVEARSDAANTLICFFSDHGEHLGDHHAWQKESFFDASCRVPMLVSWPAKLPADTRRQELVSLTDLFATATAAAGALDARDGIDLVALVQGAAAGRQHFVGIYGTPGTARVQGHGAARPMEIHLHGQRRPPAAFRSPARSA